MLSSDEFSTNRHSALEATPKNIGEAFAVRHPDLYFADGNIAILAGGQYFLVHRGLLCRHSVPLADFLMALERMPQRCIEHRPVLDLIDSTSDVLNFLLSLYDGVSALKYDTSNFHIVSGILRLALKYQVQHIRDAIVSELSRSWPTTLAQWELREAQATSATGIYKPRSTLPHPILVIVLARETGILELLPSAFYDLSRCSPSDILNGLNLNLPQGGQTVSLSDQDLMRVLTGKEHASRYLIAFVVNELEGRDASLGCLNRSDLDPTQKRICQAAFESIAFEILRDVNGVVYHRSPDPLFAIADAELMQTTEETLGRFNHVFRACEICRAEFSAAAEAARDELWRKLPVWFDVELENWA